MTQLAHYISNWLEAAKSFLEIKKLKAGEKLTERNKISHGLAKDRSVEKIRFEYVEVKSDNSEERVKEEEIEESKASNN